jgi:hypothetical protein
MAAKKGANQTLFPHRDSRDNSQSKQKPDGMIHFIGKLSDCNNRFIL